MLMVRCVSAGVGSGLLQQVRVREVTADSRHAASGRLHLPGAGLWSSAPPGTCICHPGKLGWKRTKTWRCHDEG